MRIKFPHATTEERDALIYFIQKGILKGKWSFEVRLKSKKADYVNNMDPTMRTMWEALTAKRIDAVCESDDAINIIEVKRYMLPSGIGQLLLYRYMYERQFRPTKPIRLWYVTYYYDPDVDELCKILNINTWSWVK